MFSLDSVFTRFDRRKTINLQVFCVCEREREEEQACVVQGDSNRDVPRDRDGGTRVFPVKCMRNRREVAQSCTVRVVSGLGGGVEVEWRWSGAAPRL